MKKHFCVRSLAVGVLAVLSVACSALSSARADSAALQPGIQAFRAGNYEAALEQFRSAADKKPQDIQTQMWLGLALQADGHDWEAMSAWRNGTGNPKWEPIADYLRGLAWWKMNSTKDAVAYFKDAELNNRDGKSVSFPPAREALRRLNAGESAPDISRWPDLSTLSQAGKAAAPSTAKPKSGAKPAAKKPLAKKTAAKKPVVAQKPAAAKATGAKPRAGKWVATIHNGYKGDTLTFRVSADGKRIENVEFKGHWASRNSASGFGPQVLRDLDPPKPFAVAGGAFSAVQQVPKSRMWWEFIGRFTGATSAEGSYRCAYAGGENDTYKLKWTARYVGR